MRNHLSSKTTNAGLSVFVGCRETGCENFMGTERSIDLAWSMINLTRNAPNSHQTESAKQKLFLNSHLRTSVGKTFSVRVLGEEYTAKQSLL